MAADDFESKYASLMATMIKSAVAETTKLFETMVDELKAEISTIRQENEHLKIRCQQMEDDKSESNVGSEATEPLQRTPCSSDKRDTAIQCEFAVPQADTIDECQEQPEDQQEKKHSSLLKEARGDIHEEENCQVALMVVKEESCSFIEEEADVNVINRHDQGSPLLSPGEIEGPLIKEVVSLRDKIPLMLKPFRLENSRELQTHSCAPHHCLVIQEPVALDANSQTFHNSSEMAVEGDLTISTENDLGDNQEQLVVESPQKEPLVSVYQESQKEADVSVIYANVSLPQCADVPQEEEQLEMSTTVENISDEDLESDSTDGKSSPQPKKTKVQNRGRRPRRKKQSKSQKKQPVNQCPSISDHMYTSRANTRASKRGKSHEVDTENTGPNRASKDTTSTNPLPRKRRNTELKVAESSNVGTPPVCSGKKRLAESRPFKETGEVIPTNETSPATKIQHILTAKYQPPTLRPRGRRSSVTLEDAMLLVEAMYQSRRENAGSSSSTTTTQSQAQGAPCAHALETVDEDAGIEETPVALQAEVESSVPVTKQSQPTVETISAACLTSHATQTSESPAPVKVEHVHHVSSGANLRAAPLSTSVSQATAQTSRPIFSPSLIAMTAPSKTGNNPLPHSILLASHNLSSAQLSAVVSAVVSAQKTKPSSSSTVGGTPPRTSGPQKKIYFTPVKTPMLAKSAGTSTVNQSMIRPSQQIYIIPRPISTVGSQKQPTFFLTTKPPEGVPNVLASTSLLVSSSPLIVSSSKQSDISVSKPNASEVRVTVPSTQLPSVSHQLSTVDAETVSNEVCTMSQNRDNISDNLDSQKPSELVSERADASSEPSASPKAIVPPEPEETLSAVDIPPPDEPKESAVVTLMGLSSTMNEETAVVSGVLSNESSETCIPTQATSGLEETPLLLAKSSNDQEETSSPSDMPEYPSEICLHLDVSQTSEDANHFLKAINSASTLPAETQSAEPEPAETESAEPEPVVTEQAVTEPAATGVNEISTPLSCQFSLNDSINGDGAQDCVLEDDSGEQQKKSAGKLSSIMPKDGSDPHLKMTKSQFLAKLDISPVVQVPAMVSLGSSEKIGADNARKTKNKKPCRTTIMARLRSHFKDHLQSKRTEPKRPVELETTCVAPKKPKLDNNDPNDKNEGVNIKPEEINHSNSIPLPISEPCENETITRDSKLSANNVSPTKRIRQPASVSRGRSSRHKTQTPSPVETNSTSKSPNSSSSRTKSTDVAGTRPSKSTLSKSATTSGFSSISSTPLTRKRSTASKDVPDTKLVKRKLNAVSPGRTDTPVSTRTSIKTGSPGARWTRVSHGVDSPKKSVGLSPSKKPRLVKDDTIGKTLLRVVNTKKLDTAAKVNTATKMKKSNQSLLQIGGKRPQLRGKQTGCRDVKKVTAKGIWTPPLPPASKTSPAAEAKSKKETKCQTPNLVYPPTPSLHPILVRGPSIISPLQPLSVIGGRLLKNQCGECGRVFNTSTALETHVGLHTRNRPFSCKLCGKSFLDSKGLKRHDRVHRNGRVHVCPKCGKGFAYSFCLTKHLQMVHGKVRPFNCKVCKKGFFTKRDLEGHIRIHTGEKPFHCNLCERQFPRRADLNVHLRWHNGEKRHWCPFCGKGFLDYNNLKRHKYIHTGEKPHACPHCPKCFTQSSHLKKHLRNVHKV